MRSVLRIFAILESFSAESPTLTLQEIADRSALSKATAFRLVQSLDKAGYLVRLENQAYCLSHRFTRLAGLVSSTLNVRQVARPIMVELSRASHESVTLNTVDGDDRVCLDVVDVPSVLMSVSRPGMHVPLKDGASSKTLMAFMPRAEQKRVIALAARASKRKVADLVAELEQVAQRGYCVTYDERALGIAAVSAPIRDVNGEVRYAITITAPAVRAKPREKDFIALVREAAADLSRRLGATLPAEVPATEPRKVEGPRKAAKAPARRRKPASAP